MKEQLIKVTIPINSMLVYLCSETVYKLRFVNQINSNVRVKEEVRIGLNQ